MMIATVELIYEPPWLRKYTTRLMIAVEIEHITPSKKAKKNL